MRNKSDLSWQKFGERDPYYGVLTYDKFRDQNLNDELATTFFDTGERHVEAVLSIAANRFGPIASRKSALDFGCGVGRLVIPLAREFDRVTGLDVAPGMLDKAAQNCLERGIHNAEFVRSDDELSGLTGKYDFIHSYLVFQHIPPERGDKIITQLIERLSDDGILMLHFPILRRASSTTNLIYSARKNISPLHYLANIVQRKPWNEPFIQMNTYDVNHTLISLSTHGITSVFVELIDAGGYVSAFVFARKSAQTVENVAGKGLRAAEL